jgi:hypothetical protein
MIVLDVSGKSKEALVTIYVCFIPQVFASWILSASNLSNSGSPNPCKCVTGLRLTRDTSFMIFSNNPKSMKPRFLDSVSRGHMTHAALQ